MADYVPSTTNIWPYYSVTNKSSDKSGQDKAMGKDEFLKILIAQIQNQDPMQPMEDKEFIAQMAQFTSVEQLMNMAKSMDRLTQSIGISSSLIGKTITWEVKPINGGNPIVRSGYVNSISVKDGESFAVVDKEEIAISRILSVALTPPSQTGGQEEGENEQ